MIKAQANVNWKEYIGKRCLVFTSWDNRAEPTEVVVLEVSPSGLVKFSFSQGSWGKWTDPILYRLIDVLEKTTTTELPMSPCS